MTLSHWDDVEAEVRDVGEMRATFRAHYPRSKKAWLGRVLVRLELADDYWEGET